MANPAIVSCPVDVWTKVATNVTTGRVWNMKRGIASGLAHTYRLTGEAAPDDDDDAAEGVPFGVATNGTVEEISAAAAIDVYIMAKGAAGSVRVDV